MWKTWKFSLDIAGIALLLVVIFPSLPEAVCGDIDPAGLVPGNGVCTGLTLDGEPRTAYTYTELTEIINGGASFYAGYGFVAAAFQNYTAIFDETTTWASLELFNQGTPSNAQNLYNDSGSGSGDPIPAGDWPGTGEARQRAAFGYTTVQFREECFFSTIQVYSQHEDALASAVCVGGEICEMIQGATPAANDSWGSVKQLFR